MCEVKKICNKKDCHLVGIEQDICNFPFRNKKKNKYNSYCKNCSNKTAKNKIIENKKECKRNLIPISVKICSNKKCEAIGLQFINPNDELSDFHWRNCLNNYNSLCKICISKQKNEYVKENKENISNRDKKYYKENKEDILERNKKYYQENKEEILERNKIYQKENKEDILKQRKKYRNDRRKNDPIFRLRQDISKLINYGLKNNNSSKNGESCFKYLSYTKEELKEYIEKLFKMTENKWMNWNNQGLYKIEEWNDNDPTTWKWQLDHIIPHSEFPYTSMDCDLFRECWALENLRPYSAKLNVEEGNKRTQEQNIKIKEEISQYLNK